VGQQKYFYAEGLFRRLQVIIGDIKTKSPFEIQVQSLKRYKDVMLNFQRKSEADELDHLLQDTCQPILPSLEMHATFDDYEFKTS